MTIPASIRINVPDQGIYTIETRDNHGEMLVQQGTYGVLFERGNLIGGEMRRAAAENSLVLDQAQRALDAIGQLKPGLASAGDPTWAATWDAIQGEVLAVMEENGLGNRMPPQEANLTVDIYGEVAGGGTGVIYTKQVTATWPPVAVDNATHPTVDEIGYGVPFVHTHDPNGDVFVYLPPVHPWFPPDFATVTSVGEISYSTPDPSQAQDMFSALQNAATQAAQTSTEYGQTLQDMMSTYDTYIKAAIAVVQAYYQNAMAFLRNLKS